MVNIDHLLFLFQLFCMPSVFLCINAELFASNCLCVLIPNQRLNSFCNSISKCACVFVCVFVSACVCVEETERERKKEREKESFMWVYMCVRTCMHDVCVCMYAF